jgi:hypothetical protein
VAYNGMRQKEALAWITANKKHFLQLSVERLFRFWFPDSVRGYQTLFVSSISLLAFAGLFIIGRSNWRLAVWLAGVLVSYSAVFTIIQANVRYTYPVLWLMETLAAVTIVALLRHIVPARVASLARPRARV